MDATITEYMMMTYTTASISSSTLVTEPNDGTNGEPEEPTMWYIINVIGMY